MAFRTATLERAATFNSESSQRLYESYQKASEEEVLTKYSKTASKTIAPSSFRCLRKTWFRLRGVEADTPSQPDIGLEFTAIIGTACHEMIQRRLINYFKNCSEFKWINVKDYISEKFEEKESNFTCTVSGYETQVHCNHIPMNFAVDGILKDKNGYILLEIKSASYQSWEELTDPKEEHIDQIKCYGTVLNLTRSIVIYIDRQYGQIKCYEIPILPGDFEYINNRISEVIDYAECGLAPEGLPVGDKWCNSGYCPYFQKCKEYGR